MNTALKNDNILDFNAFREQRLHTANATHNTTAHNATAIQATAPVVVWWPVWVLVPQQEQQAEPTIQ